MNQSAYYLCIDYGKSKIGVAVGSMVPTTPLEVIRYSNRDFLINQLQFIIEQEKPDELLLGWPLEHLHQSSEQAEEIRQFGDMLGRLTGLPVVYYPETLTTQLAERRMIEAGISKKRRREVEDSFAAAAILDSYLEELSSQ